MSEVRKVENVEVNPHSATIKRNAKGDYALDVKSYGETVLTAVATAVEGIKKLEEEIASHQAG